MSDHDEKLKIAAAEIKMIMRKHSIGGFVSLVSKSHAEFVLEFPEWSCAQFTDVKDGVRLKCKSENFESSEHQRVALEETMHLILSTRDMAAINFKNMDDLSRMVEDEGVQIEHHPFKNMKHHEEH